MGEQTLDDVLAGKEPEETGEVEETVEDSQEESVETETPAEDAKADKPDDSTPESDSKNATVPLAAVLDEREKRQKAQKLAEELQQKLDAATKLEDKRPDVFEDPDGAFSHIESKLENDRLRDRMDMSRDFMSMLKDDYAERETQFLELAKEDDGLIQKLRSHPNPARFAYETAVKHEQVQKMENIDEWREEERARLRQEILDEMKNAETEKAQKDQKKREAITPSLAKGRSDGGLAEVQDDDLDSMLTGVG